MLERRQRRNAGILLVVTLLCGLAVEAALGDYPCKKLAASPGAKNDLFGVAVAIDGGRAIIGAPGASRCAYVFGFGANGWYQQATLTIPDAPEGFGASVAIAGNLAVVGSGGGSGAGDVGKVWVFRYNIFGPGGIPGWKLEDTLYNEDSTDQGHNPQLGEQFGASLSLWVDSGRPGRMAAPGFSYTPAGMLVVGAPGFGASKGCVRVYELWYCESTAVPGLPQYVLWNNVATLTAPAGAAGDKFGGAVSGSGDTFAVGAPKDAEGGDKAGFVYVFHRVASGAWEKEIKFTGEENSGFGSSVCLSGATLAVGSPLIGDNGKATVYTVTTTCRASPFPGIAGGCDREWSEGEVHEPLQVQQSSLHYGEAVALDGNRLVVGATLKRIEYPIDVQGRAFVLERTSSSNPSVFPPVFSDYNEVAVLYPLKDTADLPIQAGCSVATSGSHILVGCRYDAAVPGEVFFYEAQ